VSIFVHRTIVLPVAQIMRTQTRVVMDPFKLSTNMMSAPAGIVPGHKRILDNGGGKSVAAVLKNADTMKFTCAISVRFAPLALFGAVLTRREHDQTAPSQTAVDFLIVHDQLTCCGVVGPTAKDRPLDRKTERDFRNRLKSIAKKPITATSGSV
jgi:hypothetical protein